MCRVCPVNAREILKPMRSHIFCTRNCKNVTKFFSLARTGVEGESSTLTSYSTLTNVITENSVYWGLAKKNMIAILRGIYPCISPYHVSNFVLIWNISVLSNFEHIHLLSRNVPKLHFRRGLNLKFYLQSWFSKLSDQLIGKFTVSYLPSNYVCVTTNENHWSNIQEQESYSLLIITQYRYIFLIFMSFYLKVHVVFTRITFVPFHMFGDILFNVFFFSCNTSNTTKFQTIFWTPYICATLPINLLVLID